MALDLARLASVIDFARAFAARRAWRLRLLVNNAGVNASSFRGETRTELGHEVIFTVNYLGHFLLTRLLTPHLLAAAPARVVNVSSVMHRFGSTDFARAAREHSSLSYSTSKLAQVLFSNEFNRRYATRGVIAISVSPGSVNSDIWRGFPKCVEVAFAPLRRCIFLAPAQGASTSLFAALEFEPPQPLPPPHASDAERRKQLHFYFAPYWVPEGRFALAFELLGRHRRAHRVASAECTHDPRLAADLWRLSDALVREAPGAALPD
jgi:NAD(P)-dependent dehydrogenase (short-subunit alcohol dehydrogenase family)